MESAVLDSPATPAMTVVRKQLNVRPSNGFNPRATSFKRTEPHKLYRMLCTKAAQIGLTAPRTMFKYGQRKFGFGGSCRNPSADEYHLLWSKAMDIEIGHACRSQSLSPEEAARQGSRLRKTRVLIAMLRDYLHEGSRIHH